MRLSIFSVYALWTFGTYLLLCSICQASENLIPVHRKSETWNTLITNGGFEADKLVVVGNRGSLLNVVPTGWKMAHGVSLIAYKSFPKFLQDHAGEIYLAMQSISGFLAQEVSVQSGKKVKLSFSVLSYCLTAECVQNGISVYTSSSIPVQPESSKLVYQYISNEMNVWLKKSITFIAPSDQFNVSFYAFSDGPRSSGLLIDNIELVAVEEESPYVPIEGKTAEPSMLSTFAPTTDTIPIVGNLSSGEASSVTFVTKPAPKPKPGPLPAGSGPGPKAPPLLPGVMDKKPQNPFSTKHELAPAASAGGASHSSSSKGASSTDVDNTLEQQVQNQLSDESTGDGDNEEGRVGQSTQSNDESITSMASGGIGTTETASNSAIRVVKKKSEETLSGCPLRIELLDSWGDGWHGAYLSISNAFGVSGSNDYGISTNGIVTVEPHANLLGRSSWQGTVFVKGDSAAETMITIADVNKRVPREAWEIFWVVTLPDYSLFVGNYESELTLSCHLDAEGDSGSGKFVAKITHVQKPVEDGVCTKCPQGDRARSFNQEESLHHQSLLRDFTTIGFSGKDAEAAVLSAPPRHLLKRKSRKLNHDNTGGQSHAEYSLSIDVLNSAGRGWFNDTLVSTFYTISDSTRTHLIAKGTLCGRESHDHCVETLGDGDYVFRVTGNLDSRSSENSWEFCGLRGSAQQELTFTIKSGQCIAGHLTFAIEAEDEEEYDYEIGEKMGPIRGYDSSIKFDVISSGSPDNEAIEITHKSSSMKSPATTTGTYDSSSQTATDATDNQDSSTFLGTAQAVTQSIQSVATDRFDALRRGELALEDCVIGVGSIFVLAFIVTLIVQRRSVQAATACVNDNATACVNELPLPIRKKRVRFMLGVSPGLTYSALGQISTEPLVPRVDL